jgi:lipopolysaccharide transport system ATP-binding protein
MSDIAVRVEHLGKLYHIGQGKKARYETLSERITGIAQAPLRSMASVLRGQSSAVPTDTIWALKDVSFEVKHGEVVGIIGRNGAGKSTLLKILSQITEPTEGCIDIYGRVGALLEVGTGFHPELTGRENVYLNGAILGMRRHEIDRKFEEIVDFSGVEKFIDTPVKHYSSGMQVRLAFSVAAHLEPEILIVDEVLAVGDAEFQKKCLGKMGDVTQEGRTVLFVSHNMGAVRSLTSRSILLRNGEMAALGSTDEIIHTYLTESLEKGTQEHTDLSFFRRSNRDEGHVDFVGIRVEGEAVQEAGFPIGSELTVYMELAVHTAVRGVGFTIVIKNAEGTRVVVLASWDSGFTASFDPGRHTVRVSLGEIPLGSCLIYVQIAFP